LISVDARTIIPLTPPKHHNKIPWQHHSFCVLSFSYSHCFSLTDVSSVLPFIPAQNIILLPFYMLLSNPFSSLPLHTHKISFPNGILPFLDVISPLLCIFFLSYSLFDK
jgi:hypothetical protein